MKRILLITIIFLLSFAKHSFSQVPTGGNIIGPTSACLGVVGFYKVEGVIGATDYEWTITGLDASSIDKITSKTQRSVTFSSKNTVSITVIPKNSNGAGAPITFTTTVNGLPQKPTITQQGNTLSVPNVSGVTYQWYLNNVAISGATSRTYTITTTGVYDVELKNASGCSIKSDKRHSYPTSVKEDSQFTSFTFYPNPIIDSKITTNFSEKYDLQFFSLNGTLVGEQKNLRGEVLTDLSTISSGVYLMKVISNNKIANRKIIVK